MSISFKLFESRQELRIHGYLIWDAGLTKSVLFEVYARRSTQSITKFVQRCYIFVGIQNKSLSWFNSFLHNRKQFCSSSIRPSLGGWGVANILHCQALSVSTVHLCDPWRSTGVCASLPVSHSTCGDPLQASVSTRCKRSFCLQAATSRANRRQ